MTDQSDSGNGVIATEDEAEQTYVQNRILHEQLEVRMCKLNFGFKYLRF